MEVYDLIVPMGILSFLSLGGAVVTGLLVRRVARKRFMLRLHMSLGLAALLSGLAHALIIFSAR